MDPPATQSNDSSGMERRAEADRRRKPTDLWGAFPPAGHRARVRRADQRRRPHFLDRFPPSMLALVLLLLAASIADAVLTVQLLQAGSDEMNPLMGWLLEHGIVPFVVGKYVLTTIGIPLLVVFSNHYLFGGRIRIGHLVTVLVAMYLVLLGYEVVLMHQQALW